MSTGIQRQSTTVDRTHFRQLAARLDSFTICFIVSLAIHTAIAIMSSVMSHRATLQRQPLIPVSLLDSQRTDNPPPVAEVPVVEKKLPEPKRIEKPKVASKVVKEILTRMPEKPAPQLSAKQPAPATDVKPNDAPQPEPATAARASGGASEGSTDRVSGNGNTGVTVGAGPNAAGGRGTGNSGLAKGSGAPELPAQSAPLQTGREARLVQTVRASYPPMALRRGIESDVTLRIIVDAQGIVTQAEVIKGGGPGFDEEALKAVKQSRFVPAQKDGQNVSAEFTFVYRFRLAR